MVISPGLGVALKMGRRLSIGVNIRGRDHEGRRSEKISPASDPMKVAQYEVLGSLFLSGVRPGGTIGGCLCY